jgi:membrane associated rhomboid family serine protease
MIHDHGSVIDPFREALRAAWKRSTGSVSLVLAIAGGAAYLIVAFLELVGLTARQQVYEVFGLSYVGIVVHGRIYQFVTGLFLHMGLVHLLFNTLTVWMLGPDVEQRMSRRRVMAFYALCAGAGMLGFLLLSWGRPLIMVGYSSILFGLLAAQAKWFPDRTLMLFALYPIKMKHGALLFGAIALYLSLTAGPSGLPYASSLLGGLAGYVFLVLTDSDIDRGLPGRREGGGAGKTAVPCKSFKIPKKI